MTIIDMDKIGEALNTKADVDLNNTGVFSTSSGGVNLVQSTPSDAKGKEVVSADFSLNQGGDGGDVITLQQTSGTFTLETNKNYTFSVSGESSIAIAEPANKSIINQTFIEMQLQSVVAVNWGDVLFVNGEAPDISTVGTYMVYYQWSLGGNKWLVGAYKVGA